MLTCETMSETTLAQVEAETIKLNMIKFPDYINKVIIPEMIKHKMIDCPIAEKDYFWRISGDGEMQKAFKNDLAMTVEYLHRNAMRVVDPVSALIGFNMDSFSHVHYKEH